MRPRMRLAGLAGALLLGLAAGCSRAPSAGALSVKCQLDPSPPRVGPTTISLALSDERGVEVSGASVRVEGNMNHAGMVPVSAQATEREPGHYEAALEFTMGGDWYLAVEADLGDGRVLASTVDVRGVAAR